MRGAVRQSGVVFPEDTHLMLRVTGDEVAPAIELIQRLDLGD